MKSAAEHNTLAKNPNVFFQLVFTSEDNNRIYFREQKNTFSHSSSERRY